MNTLMLSKVAQHIGLESYAPEGSIEAFFEIFERMRDEGAVVIVKLDGERKSSPYTVVITRGASTPDGGVYRKDDSDLVKAMMSCILQYAEVEWGFRWQ